MLYLSKLESKLDEALSKETRESLTEWIGHKRKKPLNQNKMKQYKKKLRRSRRRLFGKSTIRFFLDWNGYHFNNKLFII